MGMLNAPHPLSSDIAWLMTNVLKFVFVSIVLVGEVHVIGRRPEVVDLVSALLSDGDILFNV